MGTFCYTSGNMYIAIFLVSLTPFSHSVNFQVSRFSPDLPFIVLKGDAVISDGEIELNKINYAYCVGQVIYNGNRDGLRGMLEEFLHPSLNGNVPMWHSNSGEHADFTTHFSFSNPEWDPPYDHVRINENSIVSSVTTPWNVSVHSGHPADAWITYNSTSRNLSVFWSYGGGQNSSLSYQIDLKVVLPQWVTVGISAATGVNVERHTLGSWEFSSSPDIKERNGNNLKKIGLVSGLTLSRCILIAIVVVALLVLKKRKELKL